jgi:hypothetical protein
MPWLRADLGTEMAEGPDLQNLGFEGPKDNVKVQG